MGNYEYADGFENAGSMNSMNVLDCSKIVEKILKMDLFPDFRYV